MRNEGRGLPVARLTAVVERLRFLGHNAAGVERRAAGLKRACKQRLLATKRHRDTELLVRRASGRIVGAEFALGRCHIGCCAAQRECSGVVGGERIAYLLFSAPNGGRSDLRSSP